MKFSIIIPIYNVAPYLRECLDSVLAQTFSDWECICVDDGSTDGSGAILDEYAGRDSRFKVFHRQKSGVGETRNFALSAAKGEWVLFLDADDVWNEHLCHKLIAEIEEHPESRLLRFGYEGFDDGCLCPCSVLSCEWRVVDISHFEAVSDFAFYLWQFAYRRELISGVSFPRYIRGEDRVFLLRVLGNKVDSYLATDDKYYFYRKRAGSAMNSRPSVQALKDELSHRIDVVEIVDDSGKGSRYSGNYWLEKYCVQIYLITTEINGGYDQAEQCELVEWFYKELPRLKMVKGYSKRAKIMIWAYDHFRFRSARYMICHFLPLWLGRFRNLLTSPRKVITRVAQRLFNARVSCV